MQEYKHDNENTSLPRLEESLALLRAKQKRYQDHIDGQPDMFPGLRRRFLLRISEFEEHLVYMRRKLDNFYRAREAIRQTLHPVSLHLVETEIQSRG